jgi:hypothetical protein
MDHTRGRGPTRGGEAAANSPSHTCPEGTLEHLGDDSPRGSEAYATIRNGNYQAAFFVFAGVMRLADGLTSDVAMLLVLARATYAKRSRRRLNAFRAQAQ